MFNSCVQLPPNGKGKVLKGKHKLKDFHTSECVQLKNKSDLIQIRPTDLVIHDVRKILSLYFELYFYWFYMLLLFSLILIK
ncbi:hypothetical protein Lalb_Chr22g0358721 [Lupinus albus]|uniref:Uncharacterized protein n=1 Tax=Lupinus albus TaxID=3870 RepID=A0A6A4NMH3_LUPAL|nr:hypothetical protein Lalb_Chr22g0358721 [Lupinus albus]